MAISWKVAAFLLLGVIPLVFYPDPLMLTGWIVFVAIITVLDTLAAVNPRTFTYERTVGSPIRADQTTHSTVRISSPHRRGARISVRDAWQPSVRPRPYVHHGLLTSAAPFEAVTSLAPERRGIRRGQELTIRVYGPLGLGARQVSIALPSELEILPEFRSRKLLASRVARLQEMEGSTAIILRGPGTEFDSLRDYVRGDDPRDIDWKASARSESLVVRTWQPERDRHVLLVVDTGRTSALLLGSAVESSDGPSPVDPDLLDIGSAPRLDANIEATLLMAGLADRAGDNVHVVAIDQDVRCRVSQAKGSALMNSVATAFRDIIPSLSPIQWSLVESEARRILRQRSLVMIFTHIPAVGRDPQLRELLSRLAARHTVVVASAEDPTLTQIAAQRNTLDEISEAACAEAELLAEQAGAEELRRLGVHTVSADAGLLAARSADKYIDLKKRGIL